MIELILPYPPSTNRIWRTSGRRVHKSSQYQNWLTAAGLSVRAQVKNARIDGPFQIHVLAVAPDKRRRDLDNLLKPTLDLLSAQGVCDDDSQCRKITAEWATNGPVGSLKVYLEKYGRA